MYGMIWYIIDDHIVKAAYFEKDDMSTYLARQIVRSYYRDSMFSLSVTVELKVLEII